MEIELMQVNVYIIAKLKTNTSQQSIKKEGVTPACTLLHLHTWRKWLGRLTATFSNCLNCDSPESKYELNSPLALGGC